MSDYPNYNPTHPKIEAITRRQIPQKTKEGYYSACGKHRFRTLWELADYGFQYFWAQRGFKKTPPTISSHLVGDPNVEDV